MHDHDDFEPKTLQSVPPPSTGYWGWIRYELKNKADERWVVSELKALKRMFDDTKVTATDAKKKAEKPYECIQMKEIEKLKDWQYKVMNWKIPIIVSLIVLVLGAAGQYFSLKDSVEDGNEARLEVQEALKEIQAQQVETSKAVLEMKLHSTENEKERRKELEDFAKQVTFELKQDLLEEKRKKKRDR